MCVMYAGARNGQRQLCGVSPSLHLFGYARPEASLMQQTPLPIKSSCLLPRVIYKYFFVFSKFLILPMK